MAGGVLLVLAGCTSPRSTLSTGGEAEALIWPDPPEKPRIAYVGSIGQPTDAGVRLAPLSRFANWITGSDKGNEALLKPFGLAVDEKDNLCLTDMGANAVCFWDRGKGRWRRWDKVGRVRFLSPVAAAKREGTIYVADSGLGRVVAFDPEGRVQFQVTDPLERPSGLAILGERLFVVDSQRHCVTVFDLRGRYLSEFGRRGTGEGELNFPTHIGADPAGYLFVTDAMNSRVQVFGVDGAYRAQIGGIGDGPGFFSRPKGVAVDTYGRVYVVDALFDNVQIFDREGRFLLNWGAAGPGPGQFWLPNGIAISRQNEIFVADSYNRRVQIFRYVGEP